MVENAPADNGDAVAITAAAATSVENGGKLKGGKRDRSDETPIEELYPCLVSEPMAPIPHVPKPSKDEHDKEVAELNAAIDALKDDRTKLQAKIDASVTKAGKSPEAEAEKEFLKTLRSKKGALISEKKVLRTRLDTIRNAADKLQNERKAARSAVRFNSVADIEAEIARLHKKQETTSMSLSEEKRLIKEIESLEASKKTVADIKTKEDALGDVKDQRKAISTAMGEKDKEIDAVSAEIDERSAKLDAIFKKESGNRDIVQKLFKERDALRKSANDKIAERNKIRDQYREDNNKWYNYQRALRRQKQIKYEEEKKAREAEKAEWLKKKEEEEAKKIPYEEEMALCDYLANYLERTYLTDADAERKKKEEELAKKKAAEVVAVKEDPFANFKAVGKKKDDEEEVFLQMGPGKKKKRQRNKAAKSQKAATFTLSVDSFEQFGLLGLTPPTSFDSVAKSVEELRARKKWYSEQPRGAVKTAQEIRKENEKNAAKIKAASSQEAFGEAAGKKTSKAFNGAGEDFAPLGEGSASASVNATWGQKPATEDGADAAADPATAEE